MVADYKKWFNKYYQGKTKRHLDAQLELNDPNGIKSLDTNMRQIYERLPSPMRLREAGESGGSANSGYVLDYYAAFEEQEKKDQLANPEGTTLPTSYGGQYVPTVRPLQTPPIQSETYQPLTQQIAVEGVNTQQLIVKKTSIPFTPPTPTPTPTPTSTIFILPFAIIAVVLIGILIILRRRA